MGLVFRSGGDSHSGQWDGWIAAHRTDVLASGPYRPEGSTYDWPPTLAGILEWTKFQGQYSVQMVEVRPEWRRTGIATELYRKLFDDEGITERDLQPSYQTDAGMAFRSGLRLPNVDALMRNRSKKSNPNDLLGIRAPAHLDPVIREGLVGSYRTETGTEIFVWSHEPPDGPFYLDVHRPSGEVFRPEDWPDQDTQFNTVMEALGTGMRIAAEADAATWHAGVDVDENIETFLSAPRNRVEFYRFFSWNDPNGNYRTVLTDDPEQILEVFDDVFGDVPEITSAQPPRVETFQAIKKRLLRE